MKQVDQDLAESLLVAPDQWAGLVETLRLQADPLAIGKGAQAIDRGIDHVGHSDLVEVELGRAALDA